MDDINRVDKFTEYKMTNAIQKAAMLALTSPNKDKSELLAEVLLSDDIPKQFTKVAAMAFNRRLSINKIAAASEEHKADNFDIADVEKVEQLRGVGMNKSASMMPVMGAFSFHISQTSNGITKSASFKAAIPAPTIEQITQKFLTALDKGYNEFLRMNQELLSKEASLLNVTKTAALLLRDNERLSKQLYTAFGEDYKSLFADKLPEGHMVKSAAYVVLPENHAVELVDNAIKLNQQIKAGTDALNKKAAELRDIAQAASQYETITSTGILGGVINKRDLSGIVDLIVGGLSKKADGYTVAKDILANAIAAPLIVGGPVAEGAYETTKQGLVDTYGKLLSRDYAASPLSMLSPLLILQDKLDNKKAAKADIMADALFKDYPILDVEEAFLRAYRTNLQFLSPRFSLLLRAAVAQRLPTRGVASLAMLASEATTAKALAEAAEHISKLRAASQIFGMLDKHTKDLDFALPLPDKLIDTLKYSKLPYNLRDDIKEWKKLKLEAYAKDTALKEKLAEARLLNIKSMVLGKAKLLKARMKTIFNTAQRSLNKHDILHGKKFNLLTYAELKQLENRAALAPASTFLKDLNGNPIKMKGVNAMSPALIQNELNTIYAASGDGGKKKKGK